jgi:ubiquinone/menaquinone biosynthesis methyltransferase
VARLIADVGARAAGPVGHALAVRAMFDRISPTYDLLNRLLSAGVDLRWRARALEVLSEGLPAGPLLDSCAGTLDLTGLMDARFPGRPLLAVDFAREMLVRGRGKVSPAVAVAAGDAMLLPLRSGALAGMTCAFGMRNLADVQQGLAEAYRVLGPGGVLVVLEFFRPSSLATRAFHTVYARAVLPALGALVSRDHEAYAYLSRSMRGFHTRSGFEALGRQAGFAEVRGEDLTFGVASLVRMVK